jgi:hypothetical protein
MVPVAAAQVILVQTEVLVELTVAAVVVARVFSLVPPRQDLELMASSSLTIRQHPAETCSSCSNNSKE